MICLAYRQLAELAGVFVGVYILVRVVFVLLQCRDDHETDQDTRY